MAYPTSIQSFTTKQDGANQTVQAAHVNDLQTEVTAIETGLLNGLQHALTVSTGGLTVSTGNAVFGQEIRAVNQPRCMLTSSAAQSFAADVFTPVTFETEAFDVGGLHSTATNPSRITIPTGSSGLYMFGGSVRMSTINGGAACLVRISKNSTTEVGSGAFVPRSSVVNVTLRVQHPVVTDAGDWFELDVFPVTSTGSVPVSDPRRQQQEFWCVKLW